MQLRNRHDSRALFSLKKVKRLTVSTATDLKACLIQELLGTHIPEASVDYQGAGGMHRFVVLCQGLKYELSFLHRLLDACNAEDITNALRVVVERIQTRAAPRRIKFGPMAAHRSATL